jgi:hypothetical protein
MISPSALGWILQIAGSILWAYGYFVHGSLPFVDWSSISPSWIAEWLPNWQSEIGCGLALVGMVPLYWPAKK